MAKIKWIEPDASGFGGDLQLSINSNHTKAVFTDVANDGRIILFGENLKAKAGNLDSGSIDKVVFKNGDGDQVIVATDGNFKIADIAAAAGDDNALGVYLSLFNGDDTIAGSNGDDNLSCLRGDDKLSAARATMN